MRLLPGLTALLGLALAGPAHAVRAAAGRRAGRLGDAAREAKRRFRGRLRNVRVFASGSPVKRVRDINTSGFKIDLRGRRAGLVRVRIVMTLRNGRRKVDTRTFRTCAKRRAR